MTDYAAAPSQPIVQGLLTVSGSTPTFTGKGVESVTRSASGDFVLQLDPGLPGNAGELDPDQARSMVTLRGGSGSPPVTTITQTAVTYQDSGTADGGFDQVRVVFSIAGTATDPNGAAAGGAEIVVWKGL